MAMHPNKSIPATKKINASEIADDMSPFLRRYKDGRVERLVPSPLVPASEAPSGEYSGVATRDVVIDTSSNGVSVRLFLSVAAAATSSKRLPLVVYFHGGAFCTGSPFSEPYHRYAASLAARAAAVVVSVDYRLAPEHPVPAAYDDAWEAIRWAASFSDPWLCFHADPARLFLAGESAGANIVHNMAARAAAGLDNAGDGIDIEGVIVLHPYFWGTERLSSEANWARGEYVFSPEWADTFWPFLTAGAAGNDDPRVSPPVEVVASLPTRRALVAVAAKDLFRERACRYAAWLRRHGEREVTLVESEGEDHTFHLYRPSHDNAVALMDAVVDFINNWAAPSPITDAKTEWSPAREGAARTCMAVVANDGPGDEAHGRAKLDQAISVKKVPKGPFPPAALENRTMAKSRL